MPTITLHHAGNYQSCHCKQAHDVRIDHCFPLFEIALVFGFQTQCQTSVINQHVYLLPFSRQFLDVLRCLLAVSHVESQRQHVGILFC